MEHVQLPSHHLSLMAIIQSETYMKEKPNCVVPDPQLHSYGYRSSSVYVISTNTLSTNMFFATTFILDVQLGTLWYLNKLKQFDSTQKFVYRRPVIPGCAGCTMSLQRASDEVVLIMTKYIKLQNLFQLSGIYNLLHISRESLALLLAA